MENFTLIGLFVVTFMILFFINIILHALTGEYEEITFASFIFCALLSMIIVIFIHYNPENNKNISNSSNNVIEEVQK